MDLGDFINMTYIDANGVYRYKAGHHVPEQHTLESFINDRATVERCAQARSREAVNFVAFRSIYRRG